MERLKSVGKIVFDPIPLTGKVEKMFKPYWAIIVTNDDIDDYYRWHLQKRFGIILQAPAWGPHVTIADGTEPKNIKIWEEVKSKYNNQLIEFEYEIFIKSNSKHWWLKVVCPEVDVIRKELEFDSDLKWSLHLTLGLPIPRLVEHSVYIHRIELQRNNISKFVLNKKLCNIFQTFSFKSYEKL